MTIENLSPPHQNTLFRFNLNSDDDLRKLEHDLPKWLLLGAKHYKATIETRRVVTLAELAVLYKNE